MKGLTIKIGYFHMMLILLRVEDINGSFFFHELSYIELHSADSKIDFGFSIAYQSKLKSLVVGAPHSDLNGTVYKCPLDEAVKQKELACSNINIDMDKLASDYSRNNSIDQNFCLGASISATPEYVFTCAPLWTSYFEDGEKLKFGALGTCFVTNGTYVSRYNGLLEQYVQKTSEMVPKIGNIYGGIGWNTLYDPKNELILIAKPSLMSSISVMQANDPLKPTSAVKTLEYKFNEYYFLGQSLAAGVFFNNELMLYAFSMISKSRLSGAIAFLYYDSRNKLMKILEGRTRPILIEDDLINSMYGASLHSVNLNGDKYSELLVGAPTWTNDVNMYEHGAVLFYLGGGKPTSERNYNLCICGIEDGSRFGTAIGSSDIDGDDFPEIFISAPYEKSDNGAVYILSGYEIMKMLPNTDSKISIKVSELTNIQRIKNVPYKSFGFSILPVRDFDENVGNLLAVGSPDNGTVVLFRSIPFINVHVTALLLGKERVMDEDMNFTVAVSVNVTFPETPNEMSGRLFVSTNIIGDAARIENSTYIIDITKEKSLYTNEVIVLLNNTDPGSYKLNVKVDSDIKLLDKPDFDKSLFLISNRSKPETVLDIERRSKDVGMPRLSMNDWPGSTKNVYVLGSTASENITVVVRNDGYVTYDSCARIKVTGVKALVVGCIQNEEWYKCDLVNIERHQERLINIRLDLSKATNKDNGLEVEVLLYNICVASANATVRKTKKIAFELDTTDVSIDFLSYDRNVTLSEIQDTETSKFIDVREVFTVITSDMNECKQVSSKDQVVYNCIIDLKPMSSFKITTERNILKEKMMEIFDNDKISLNTTYKLVLEPTLITLNKT
ncbi:unnamed protein product [Euphydryas editha]|uniref:Uncharacterized protein n=1 Tax=Euphydryas editha TaxID=104508 RepID=A0AAU9TGD5_EUPED|nr:unnamed protein product [Euphydryas editha]